MKVYSLSGRSGTGKSFQAINLCKEKNIESIIDDGLFICRNKVICGISAKRERTIIGAVKAAIFADEERAEEAKAAIARMKPNSILILGTSDEMINRIVERLELPEPEERIYIEEITTEEERGIARKQRKERKQHPVKKGKKTGTINMNSQDIEVVVTESVPTEQAARQPQKVRGIVRDKEKGEPIVGAIIKVGNSKAGTVTDRNGEFSIDVKEGDVVVASYVGYSSDAIVIKDSQNKYAFVLEKDDSDVAEKTYDVVEQMPLFPGGPAALLEYLSKNVNYPENAHKNGVQGRVIASFFVEKDGRISHAHVVRSVDPSLDAEALRVIHSMPNWVPGRQNGEPVRVKYTIPITFKLDAAAPAEEYVLEIDGKVADDSEIANIPADDIASMDVLPALNGQPKKIVITTKKKK